MSKKPNRIIVKTPYLRDTIKELPHGIINKTETGIGATTLELESKRNSIIVEPLRVTASAKADKHNALYVGSPIGSFKKKIEKKDIKKYIDDASNEFKKIIVVADSLKKVMDAIPKSQHKDYFLMIDECDSFQLDATFRSSMETSYEIYKAHPAEKRCMISATPLSFSDPNLENENYTIIEKDKPSNRNINLIYTKNLLGSAIDKIEEVRKIYPDDKIVVAYNNVSRLYNLANEIEKTLSVDSTKISILCGLNSKIKAGKYFKELQSDTYPTYITLKTSAYFTGFDINEKYHLITLIENTDKLNCLSELRLKQIAGRGRTGLHSENVIFEYNSFKLEKITKEELIETANTEINAINCIKKSYGKSPLLKDQINTIRDLIISNTATNGFTLVKKNSNGDPEISYLNVDALLEMSRVKNEVFKNITTLKNRLIKQGNIVTESISKTSTKVEIIENNTDLLERKKSVTENLNKWSTHKAFRLISSTSDKTEQLIYDIYNSLVNYVDNNFLKDKLIELSSNRTNVLLKSFKSRAILTLLDDTSNYKQALNSQFKIHSYYSNEEIHKKINNMLLKLGIGEEVDEPKAIMLFNNFVNSTRQGKKHDNKRLVKDFNPAKIVIVKETNEIVDEKKLLEMIMMFN